jgi:purine nucleosidase
MGRYAPDGLALTVALEPSIVCKADRHHAQVESCGQHTHGQTTVDWNDRTDQAPAHAPCAVNLVLKLDKERLRELMQAACT